MNTHFANFSTLTGFVGAERPAKAKGPSLMHRIGAWFATIQRQRRDSAELARFSDRELSDVGLTRNDLDRIQTPEFAAEYRQGRNSAMFLTRA